jgi:hypothetical protein
MGRYHTSDTMKCSESISPFSLFAFWVLGSWWVASPAEVVAVLVQRRVLWDRKCQKGKREKGRQDGKQGHSAFWVRLVAVQCLQCRLSPFRVVRRKRGDVTPLTPRSALKPFSPFPFRLLGFRVMVGGVASRSCGCACREACAAGQQMPKREKGNGEARWQARTFCNLGTVCGSPVFAVSPFAFSGR